MFYGQGPGPGSQADNTMDSTVFLYDSFLLYLWFYKWLFSPAMMRTTWKGLQLVTRVSFVCTYTSENLKVLLLALFWNCFQTYSFIPGAVTNTYVILTLPRLSKHSHTTALTTSICAVCFRLGLFHYHSRSACAYFLRIHIHMKFLSVQQTYICHNTLSG